MGGIVSGNISFTGPKIEDNELEIRDDRRRNSLAYNISTFVQWEEDEYVKLVESVKHDRMGKNGGKPHALRPSSKLSVDVFKNLN